MVARSPFCVVVHSIWPYVARFSSIVSEWMNGICAFEAEVVAHDIFFMRSRFVGWWWIGIKCLDALD